MTSDTEVTKTEKHSLYAHWSLSSNVVIDNLRYTLSEDRASWSVRVANSSDLSGDITILDSVYEKPVTALRDEAFTYCRDLTSIVIPNSVIAIGDNAFNNCYALTDITIPSDSNLTSIGDFAFSSCLALTNITIPSGVTSIGNSVFIVCYNIIINVKIGESSWNDGSNNYTKHHNRLVELSTVSTIGIQIRMLLTALLYGGILGSRVIVVGHNWYALITNKERVTFELTLYLM